MGLTGDGGDGSHDNQSPVVVIGGAGGVSSSSSTFDNLTEELLIEILKRLQLKPANSCKSVSKQWLSLISSSYFGRCYARYHHHHLNSVPPFAFYYQKKSSEFSNSTPFITQLNITSQDPIFKSPGFSLSFLPCSPSDPLHYLASDNGLLLLSSTLCFQKLYYVCNPLTKQWVVLPPPPSCPRGVRIGFICYPYYYSCFHHDNQEQRGNEPTITKFKVVRIEVMNSESPLRFSDTLKVQIFCSENGQWTEEIFTSNSERKEFPWWNHDSPNAVVCNGLLHWDNLWGQGQGIFAFDPYNSKYVTIELPPEVKIREGPSPHWFGECGGHLRYLKISRRTRTLRVFELKDYSRGGEWWFLHSVQVKEMEFEDRTPITSFFSLLSVHPSDGDIIYFRYLKPGYIVEYNMRKKILKLSSFFPHEKSNLLDSTASRFVLPCWLTPVPVLQMNTLDQ